MILNACAGSIGEAETVPRAADARVADAASCSAASVTLLMFADVSAPSNDVLRDESSLAARAISFAYAK